MNKSKIKSFIKYPIIFAIIVGIGIGVKFIFFPNPKPMEAYQNVYSVMQNQTYNELKQSTEQLFELLQTHLPENPDEQTTNKRELLLSQFNIYLSVYEGLDNLNNNYCQTLLYAQTNKDYNKNTKQIKKEVKNLNKKFEEINNYIDTYYSPFYEQTTNITYNSVSSYADVISNFNIEVTNSYINILDCCYNICVGQNVDLSNNVYTQNKAKVVLSWAKMYIKDIQNVFEVSNTNTFVEFGRFNQGDAVNYFDNKQTIDESISAINICDLTALLKVVSTLQYDNYFNALELAEQQKINNAIQFILIY